MRRREDRSQLATTRHAKRYDNRTVAATTRYPEGRTSRKMTGPENTRRQPRGRGGGETRRERAKPQTPKPPGQTKKRRQPHQNHRTAATKERSPAAPRKENHTRSAQAMANQNRDIQGRQEMHGREVRTQTYHAKQCTKELEGMNIPAQSADRHTHTQSMLPAHPRPTPHSPALLFSKIDFSEYIQEG